MLEVGPSTASVFLPFGFMTQKVFLFPQPREEKRVSTSSHRGSRVNGIVVEQKLVGSEIVFSISIGGGGRKTFSLENASPSEFENVKVYSSSPWYNPANGNITSLLIATKQKGDYFMNDISYFD